MSEALNAPSFSECDRGDRLLRSGDVRRAEEVFNAVLASIGGAASYQRAVVLGRIGYCALVQGRADIATAPLQEAVSIAAALGSSSAINRLTGALHSHLGDSCRSLGKYTIAQQAYEGALTIFQQISDPRLEAKVRCQLGRLFREQRQWEAAEGHYREAAKLLQSAGDQAGAAQLWTELGQLCREAGWLDGAEAWHRKAVDWYQLTDAIQFGRSLGTLAAVVQSQPGRLAEARQLAEQALAVTQQTMSPEVAESWTIYGVLADILKMEAATAEGTRRDLLQANSFYYHQLYQYAPQFIDALARLGTNGDYGRAVVLGRLARCFQLAGRSELSVSRLHEAVAIARQFTNDDCALALQGMLQAELGDALWAAKQYSEAKEAYEAALVVAESLQDFRGQGISLSQLGSLALADGHPEEALSRQRAALASLQKVADPGLEAIAWHQLGIVFHRLGQWDETERHYGEAARLRDSAGDRNGAALLWNEFARLCREAGRPAPADSWYQKGVESETELVSLDDPRPVFEIILHEQLSTEYALEPDLLIDGPREHRVRSWVQELEPLAEDLRPMLVPCSRTYADEDNSIRVALPQGEPHVERQPGCTVMRRLRRELAISGDPDLIWRLIRKMDGSSTVADILVGLPTNKLNPAAQVLAILAASGVIDVSGRAIGRFLHSTTKKGALPAGGLQSDQVYNLATDGDYRTYPESLRIPLHESVPEVLRSFYVLTRERRSHRNFHALALQRKEFEALLCTACGVTGTTSWAGRELKLRAYPSSGALYAVEIYPIVFHVEGLDAAVYHYHAIDNALEVVQPNIDKDEIIGAMLPMERQMVSGAATMICLTGNFPRHERKYGEGGYRMLVAEAGHISQNLVLAATALGFAARPFGGVFDGLINKAIGLYESQEEFLLSVLIGHAGSRGQNAVAPSRS